MDFATPLHLIFDQPAPTICRRLAEFVASSEDLSFDGGMAPEAAKARIVHRGAIFEVAITQQLSSFAKYRRVFADSFSDQMKIALALNLGAHLQHGMVVPAIAKAYLEFALTMANGLDACSVAANAAGVASGKDYFVESTSGYCTGGPFPALALVAYDRINNGASMQTRGLDVFAGQEILLAGNGLDELEMMRRMIRLVHEIATNGAVLRRETVGDLSANAAISLEPTKGGKLLRASIQYGAN